MINEKNLENFKASLRGKLIQPDDEGNGDVGSSYNQQISTWWRDFENGVAKRQAQDTSRQTISPRSVKRGQPISAEIAKEIERLELAIRQGSVNAQ